MTKSVEGTLHEGRLLMLLPKILIVLAKYRTYSHIGQGDCDGPFLEMCHWSSLGKEWKIILLIVSAGLDNGFWHNSYKQPMQYAPPRTFVASVTIINISQHLLREWPFPIPGAGVRSSPMGLGTLRQSGMDLTQAELSHSHSLGFRTEAKIFWSVSPKG